MDNKSFQHEAVAKLMAQYQKKSVPQEQQTLIEALLSLHEREQADAEASIEMRRAFLHVIRDAPQLLENETFASFLANEIRPKDFDALQWEAPNHMMEFSEALYGFQFPTQEITQQMHNHVRQLLRQALHQYEQAGNVKQMFRLLRTTPTAPLMDDIELARMRHVARAYEIRRVRRNRRWLFAYLIVQALLVIVVFPLLFIYAENGEIQRQMEELTDLEIEDEGDTTYTFAEGLYWSTITAGSIGYGDITPATTTGRAIASILGTLGVVTAGVTAGLVLQWVTVRELD